MSSGLLENAGPAVALLLIVSSVLGAAGALAAVMLRRADAALRSTVLGTVLVVAVAAPLLIAGRALRRGHDAQISTAGGVAMKANTPAASARSVRPMEGRTAPAVLHFSVKQAAPAAVISPEMPAKASGREVFSLPGAWQQPVRILGAVWLAGCACVLLRWVAALLHLRRLRLRAETCGSIDGIVVCESPSCRQPGCAGVLRPWIILPRGWRERMPDTQLQAVLLHEAGHAHQGDVRWLHLQWIAAMLHWWNPGIWLLSRAFSLAREELCDRRVLASGVPPEAYAQCLVNAASLAAGRPHPASAGVSRSFREARIRIVSIMNKPRASRFPGPLSRTALIACAGAAAFAALQLPAGIAFAEDNEPAPPAPAQTAALPAPALAPATPAAALPPVPPAPAAVPAPSDETTPALAEPPPAGAPPAPGKLPGPAISGGPPVPVVPATPPASATTPPASATPRTSAALPAPPPMISPNTPARAHASSGPPVGVPARIGRTPAQNAANNPFNTPPVEMTPPSAGAPGPAIAGVPAPATPSPATSFTLTSDQMSLAPDGTVACKGKVRLQSGNFILDCEKLEGISKESPSSFRAVFPATLQLSGIVIETIEEGSEIQFDGASGRLETKNCRVRQIPAAAPAAGLRK